MLVALQPPAAPQEVCTPAEPTLDELSGFVAAGDRWFAVPDGGERLEVFVLDPASCAVTEVVTADTDPFDIEDLALAADGALWLADTGDNDLMRETVALHRLAPDGAADLYRLTYPDGPHDAEALLLDASGVPALVTKDVLGAAGVYRPAGPLAEPGPTPLERVGAVRLGPTDTPGGPAGRAGSAQVTGGAVSPDGSVVALRTYTDGYLFAAPGGDVLTALAGEPVRVPLPGEPQGEAVALTADGTLLSASEGGAPVRAVPGAAAQLAAPAPPPAEPFGAGEATPQPADDELLPMWQAAVLAAVVATGVVLLAGRRRT